MLKHFVFIRYRDDTPTAHIEQFCQRMYQLCEQIPDLLALEIGQDSLHDQRSWDLAMLMLFESTQKLRDYQAHPAHKAVMAFNSPYVIDVATVDYSHPVPRQCRAHSDAETHSPSPSLQP